MNNPPIPIAYINMQSECLWLSVLAVKLLPIAQPINFFFGIHFNNSNFYFNLQLEKLISKNYYLNQSAKEAFKSYLRAYDSHHLKTIFDIDTIDLAKVSKSFGFTVPPAVELKVSHKGPTQKRKGGGGYGYFKTLNKNSNKNSDKTKIYRQKGKNKRPMS